MDKKPSSKKKYFPNDIDGVMNTDFPNDVTALDFFEDRVSTWYLPSSILCVIRAENKETGKIKEYSYQRPHAARARLEKLLETGNHDIVVANNEAIHLLTPES